jgi:pimeloyl-ACP methyl ester carboxylesterase
MTSAKNFSSARAGMLTGAAALAAAGTAAWVQQRARRAEREHQPSGRRIEIEGVALHYVERGNGPPVVLIHGNTVSSADFEASGMLDRLALNHRVIAFDRPGFGHSDRPRDRLWTPATQGELLHAALARLNVDRPAIVGHSMGTLVALAMAIDKPAQVGALVLLGGYYYPSVRVDAFLTAPVAAPVLGDVMRYTVSALFARATITHMVKAMFAPNDIPPDFFPAISREMMLRPLQLRANAEDAAFMVPAAASIARRLDGLRMPVTLCAGAADGIVDPEAHSGRLHRDVPHSRLIVVPNCGHMVHYEVPDKIAAALLTQLPTQVIEAEATI